MILLVSGTPLRFFLICLLMFWTMSATVARAQPRPPNVLFISVDDWNDWVGCLGHKQARTPNVDRLASRGLLFANAHCVAPVCNPSRVATLTGLRPGTTGVYENNHVMRRKVPDVVTLPQHFRANGYHVAGGGKVFHDVPPHAHDPLSWDEYFWWNEHGPKGGKAGGGWRSPYSIAPDPEPDGRPTRKITSLTKRNFDWGTADEPESAWPDSQVANWASDFLGKEHDKPFFLSVGIFRPHVPWFNPAKYVDKFPLEKIALPPTKAGDLDDLGTWAKRRAHDKGSKHDRLVEFGEWKPAVQAYLASISFADANVGRVLDALEKSPHRDNTIVVLWSDHGYHLGEKGHWHKRTLWERATRVPLIIAAPGVTQAGGTCRRPVSLLDLYPTLVSLCGLTERTELEGNDLSSLLVNPDSKWSNAAVTTWQPGNHSVRTEDWRYIRYQTGEEELYDHRADPNEWHNLAAKPEFATRKLQLAEHLPAGKQPDKVVAAIAKSARELIFIADGKATGLTSAGTPWKTIDGKLVGSGKPNQLHASHGLGTGDFHIDATLSLDRLNGTAAAFEIGQKNFFGFEGRQNEFYLNGQIFGGRRRLMDSKEHLTEGEPFRFEVIRKGKDIRFLIDGKELLKIQHAGPLNRMAFSPWRSTMRIERFSATGNLQRAANLPRITKPMPALVDRKDVHVTDVFVPAKDGYPHIRIPSLVTAKNGDLLAFAEGRQGGDHSENDLILKRSDDGGRTWAKLQVVFERGKDVMVNPCPVVLDSGRIVMMFQHFPAGYHARAMGTRVKQLEPGVKAGKISRTLVIYSDDHGKTWSKTRDVTVQTKRPAPVISTATGPGIGIQLQRGPHRGRIIMPTNEGWFDDAKKRHFNVYACYSDDGGSTWAFGKPAPNGSPGEGNEVQMVELSDGSVMLNTRSNGGTKHRKIAISRDGGETWSPLKDENAHPESQCMGSILRYSWRDAGKSRLVFANPGTQSGRQQGTVRISYDEGKTWPVAKLFYPGGYAYSCLTKTADGSIGLLYEVDGYKRIGFARIPISALEE
jgi:arylsulfatase A-like enzyme